MAKNTVNIQNKKARFNYELLEKLDAGIVLAGTEINLSGKAKLLLQKAFVNLMKKESFLLSI